MYPSLTQFQIKFKLEGAYKVKISMGLKITLSYLQQIIWEQSRLLSSGLNHSKKKARRVCLGFCVVSEQVT